jgi:Ca-activated chloride channel family protein
MKGLLPVAILAAALSAVPDSLGPIGRRSNSEASSQRGREAFVEGRYEDASNEFGTAAEIRPGPVASFNLGTARIAAGDVAGGLQALTTAFEDEFLAADVRYNAGWAALGVGDWDNAILAYEEVLRERPGDANAKRNLEIALRKKEEQQQQQQPQRGGQDNPQPQPQPEENEGEGDQPPPQAEQQDQGTSDVDSILRSVEQQEKEELERMRRSRRGRKVDW